MVNPIDKLYNEFTTDRDLILSKEGAECYKEFTDKWHEILRETPTEQKHHYIVFRCLLLNFLTVCCKDHFRQGFKIGGRVAYRITDRIMTEYDEDE